MQTRCGLVQGIVLASMVGLAWAASPSWQKEDPSQWNGEDVYQIMNNSPWSKPARVSITTANGYGQGTGNSGSGGPWDDSAPVPGGGGMGRGGGMGTGGIGGMGGGMGRRRGGGYPTEQSTTVTVQWESALPVRLAEAKTNGSTPNPASLKPLNEYVIAVIGLPKSGLMPQGSTTTSSSTDSEAQLADRLRAVTVLSVGNQRLRPTKVELNQGRDGRTVFHFEKSEPITLHDKDAEFRIAADRMDLRKKFALKDMQFQGKLEL
jgi:hypothetical protein